MADSDRHSPPLADIDRKLYSLDVHQVQLLFDGAKLPRSIRSISRYCKTQRLDAVMVDGPTGPEWRVSEASVLRAIDELKRVVAMSDIASHGEPEPAMAELKNKDDSGSSELRHGRTQSDTGGQGSAAASYVDQLEKRIEEKDGEITFLRTELAQRNEEIVRRNERERETNLLIRGLQNLVLRLQPGRPQAADVFDGDPLMATPEGDMRAQ
jgi:hypothetical protein